MKLKRPGIWTWPFLPIGPEMEIIRHETDLPEENIAFDELFLLKAEKGGIGETLRFWESRIDFVVLGRAGKVNEECILKECMHGKVPILRRLSGGGTILQGKGCLNYSLILTYSRDKKLKHILSSYRKILEDIAEVFRSAGFGVNFFPVSDLAIGDRKISGNAQARKRSFFLHHGTFLYDFDIGKMGRYLKHPPKEPAYRNSREHDDFVVNMGCGREKIIEVITEAFRPIEEYFLTDKDLSDLSRLIKNKYSQDSWNLCF